MKKIIILVLGIIILVFSCKKENETTTEYGKYDVSFIVTKNIDTVSIYWNYANPLTDSTCLITDNGLQFHYNSIAGGKTLYLVSEIDSSNYGTVNVSWLVKNVIQKTEIFQLDSTNLKDTSFFYLK